ncbi:hypothetical protein NDI85_01355 [Halomicroarcula sp. S1AR25-4]|uniref:hypothetical protein n=1 Tax=unclassified Haloarcula TaxID=2624677 RepID=UPI00140F3E17|nr:hypothetical protein [Halomicroarcula sp. S1AR25-4]MDS0276449.1 hypothetical protein [Halomicroarcula sp. S1AR25-4]QIO21349.1 hypothetical protein G9465_02830 [Haloarcula sp. JP-L23]
MVWWLLLSLVPRDPRLYLFGGVLVALQLSGVDVLGPAIDLLSASVLDPTISWIESQFVDSWTFW